MMGGAAADARGWRVHNRSRRITGPAPAPRTEFLMPRDTRTRRLARPATGTASSSCIDAPAPPLVTLLARTPRLADLLPHLHQNAIDATGGTCSILFEHNPRNGVLQATSGFALDSLRMDSWRPGPEEAALVASTFSRHAPTLVADAARPMTDLTGRLNTHGAPLLPL